VIQIPALTQKRRNELEVLLSVFDQSTVSDAERHILNVKENDFPEKYALIIRRLQTAIADKEIKKKMILEDGLLEELADLDREIENLTCANEALLHENEQMKERLENTDKEKRRAEEEKKRAEEEKKRAEEENEALRKRIAELEKKRKDN
jgi:chromosome segregation ATPase